MLFESDWVLRRAVKEQKMSKHPKKYRMKIIIGVIV